MTAPFVYGTLVKHSVHSLEAPYQVTAVTFNDTAEQVISGGIDNELKVWDIRKQQVLHCLKGHADTITGISLSPDGSYILSNSMDNTFAFGIFVPMCRLALLIVMFIWDTTSRKILYKLPGHNGSVNDVDFSSKEPLILSGSSDKTLYLGEIED
ncbi:U5 small nuclear ribonucleoprotein 40 kDa protein [Eumeta japonica]|uniref:U5 small nuclear ribonucleoprotein 40 kDa protein n=1 Tax=Eumeta variegata TaxID=151549 RepID=A0A4C1T3K1_EUMVA|nr:U5 small nuclear ribonucleoprotein 40 kDa protein [Eumeta japonica]